MDGKSSQEYPVNAGVPKGSILSPKGSILSPTVFLPYVNNLPDDVIFDIAIYGDDTSDIFKSFLGILLPAKQVLLERL